MKAKLLLTSLVLIGHLSAQNADPFSAGAPGTTSSDPDDMFGEPATVNPDDLLPRVISICYETFSLPLSDAAALQRENLSDQELYQRMLAGLKEGKVKQDHLSAVLTLSGQLGSSEGISEFIYPTEFEPPKLPNQIGVSLGAPSSDKTDPSIDSEQLKDLKNAPSESFLSTVSTPATPTTFDTRNTGFTLEIEATMGQDNNIIDLRARTTHVDLVGLIPWGKEEALTEFPEFESRTLNLGTIITDGQTSFVGTINRPPTSKVDPDSANKVWFAFLTPTIVVIRP